MCADPFPICSSDEHATHSTSTKSDGDQSSRLLPVDLSVAVHVLDGQRPLTKGIIAKIVEGERNELEFRVGRVSLT